MVARCLKQIMLLGSFVAASASAAPLVMMFERDADSTDNEVAFRFYADLAGLQTNTPSSPDVFSPINVSSAFSTTGLTWDGSQFIMMFERDADSTDNEVAFRFYDDLAGLLSNTPSSPDVFSPINVSSAFSTTGLAAIVPGVPPPNGVPLPGTLLLLATGLVLVPAVRRRRFARPVRT